MEVEGSESCTVRERERGGVAARVEGNCSVDVHKREDKGTVRTLSAPTWECGDTSLLLLRVNSKTKTGYRKDHRGPERRRITPQEYEELSTVDYTHGLSPTIDNRRTK